MERVTSQSLASRTQGEETNGRGVEMGSRLNGFWTKQVHEEVTRTYGSSLLRIREDPLP